MSAGRMPFCSHGALRIATAIFHTLQLHLHDLIDTTPGEARKRWKFSPSDFHLLLLLHLQSGTSRTHLISLTTVQTHYKKSEMRETPVCFNCSSNLLWPVVMWVAVTTAWRVLRLRIEERPPVWRVAANILNKQSRTADTGWSPSLGVQWGVNNSSP